MRKTSKRKLFEIKMGNFRLPAKALNTPLLILIVFVNKIFIVTLNFLLSFIAVKYEGNKEKEQF